MVKSGIWLKRTERHIEAHSDPADRAGRLVYLPLLIAAAIAVKCDDRLAGLVLVAPIWHQGGR